jgi:hypothetical protein
LMSVTVTPGTIPPESVTVPRTPPVNVCAHAVLDTIETISSAVKHHRNKDFLILAFLQIEEVCRQPHQASQTQRSRT